MVRDPQRGVPKRLSLAGKVRDGVSGGIQPPMGEHHTELHGSHLLSTPGPASWPAW